MRLPFGGRELHAAAGPLGALSAALLAPAPLSERSMPDDAAPAGRRRSHAARSAPIGRLYDPLDHVAGQRR